MDLHRERFFGVLKVAFVVGLLLVGARVSTAGSGIEASPELWIDGPDNVQPGSNRGFPDVAVDDSGRRIHVWQAFVQATRTDIFLRRFDALGSPLEDPRLVNSTTADDQLIPRVAVAADGSFLVIFTSQELNPDNGATREVVRSQAYDPNGNPVGGEQFLSPLVPNRLGIIIDVAALRTADGSAGGYVAVWRSLNSSGSDTNDGIEGCLVSAEGVPGAQFQVPSDGAPSQVKPSVTELADGGFLATWTASSQVIGRRFNSAAGPIGNDFVISTSFIAQKLGNDTAIGWDGQVAVVWSDQEDNGGTNEREIYMRLFDADLNPLGPDFRVNTVITEDQTEPKVADYGPKGFLVVWESDVSSGPDLSDSIEARVVSGSNQFDADGDGVDDPQMQLNIWDDSNLQNSPGAHGRYGRLSSNWDSIGMGGDPPPDPNNDDNILGRDIEHCIFCDDLDWFHPGGSGNLWRWSSTVGETP